MPRLRRRPYALSVTTVLLKGHPTWVSVGRSRGDDVVLLHGGLSSSASLRRSIGRRLAGAYRVSAFDRRGHGRTADTGEPFHYDDMAEETIAFLEWLGRGAHIVGHSDGAIVGLLVALRRPDLVRRLVAVGANANPAGLVATEPVALEGPGFDAWAADYASRSPDGIEHARVVAEKAQRLFESEPDISTHDLEGLVTPTLLVSGDDDSTRLEHSIELFRAIPEAQLAVVAGASHAVIKEYPGEVAALIRRFLEGPVPPMTLQPVRRRPVSQG